MRARYQWSIDWADDTYQHPAAAIPDHHVMDYRLDYGTTLGARSQEIGITSGQTGSLMLFDAGGLYWEPGQLTDDQLRRPHACKLEINGVLAYRGRCYPVLGVAFGVDVQPVVWQVEGQSNSELQATEAFSHPAGGRIAQAISEASGMQVTTQSGQELTAVDWQGTWAGLLNSVAAVVGGWAVERPDGTILLMRRDTVLSAPSRLTIDDTAGISLSGSGIGPQTDMIRTRAMLTPPAMVVWGDETIYGRRCLAVEPWARNDADRVRALAARSTPTDYVRINVTDDQAAAATTADFARLAVPGEVVTAMIPTSRGARPVKFAVLRVELKGGYLKLHQRTLHGLSGTTSDIIGQMSVSARATSLGIDVTLTIPTVPDGTERFWKRSGNPVTIVDVTWIANRLSHVVQETRLRPGTEYEYCASNDPGFPPGPGTRVLRFTTPTL